VVIASRGATKIAAAVERLPGATGRTVDLRDESSVSDFFEKLGAFDHLAMTAGDWGGTRFVATKDLDLAAARDGFEIRFWGVLAAVKYGSRTIAPNGSITMTSGLMTHRPRKGAPLATAIGGAVEHLARGLAIDIAPVRINAVCPGMILTEIVKQAPEETLRAWVAGFAPAARRTSDRGRHCVCQSDAERLCDRSDTCRRRRRLAGVKSLTASTREQKVPR
jgi:NAD(P)-dependent dehydrogenase (short-subunit alcohol dehydrogenase family)